MKRIIVTGATSMIGVATIEAAIAQDNKLEVYAIVRKNTSRLSRLPDSPKINIVYSSLEGILDIKELPNDCDVLYHFAWSGTSKAERDDPMIQETNIRYTLDAVELAKRCGCSRFIGAGSQAEYGFVDGWITDKTRFSPVTSYGASKLAAGILSRKLCDQYNMKHIWGRVFSVYGPHDNDGTMIKYALEKFLNREKAYFSSATNIWNYLYEKDAGEIFFRLGNINCDSTVYRISNCTSRPLREYIMEISKIMDAEDLCEFAPTDDDSVYEIKTCDKRLFNDIGYEPRISFMEGIRMIIDSNK